MASIVEDLALVEASAELILDVKENLIGPTRDQKPGPVMLQDVIKDAIIDLEIPDEIVTYHVAENTPLALADPNQMHRVFTNLVKNALEAMEEVEEKQIIVGAGPAPAKGHVTVTITDNGCGISPDIIDKIWITFFTTKGSRFYPGLGLTAVRQILEQMEGKIHVQSQVGPESGTTFSVTLPVFEEKKPQPLQPGSATLLIVDDDDTWRQFAASKLETAGYSVTLTPHQADYGLIGLGTRLASFDLILIDNVLEQADALEIVQILKDATPEVLDKTILVASSLKVERTRDLLKLGVNDVISKPYNQTQLAAALQEALSQKI
jgi:CheY-like chemotaxis protein